LPEGTRRSGGFDFTTHEGTVRYRVTPILTENAAGDDILGRPLVTLVTPDGQVAQVRAATRLRREHGRQRLMRPVEREAVEESTLGGQGGCRVRLSVCTRNPEIDPKVQGVEFIQALNGAWHTTLRRLTVEPPHESR
jgi:hypothetical protein